MFCINLQWQSIAYNIYFCCIIDPEPHFILISSSECGVTKGIFQLKILLLHWCSAVTEFSIQ